MSRAGELREELALIGRALRQSAMSVSSDPDHLASQLYGRLIGETTDGRLPERIAARDRPWLMPLTGGLISAASPLMAILPASGQTEKAALSPDARWAVTVNEDTIAEVWDTGLAVKTGVVELERLDYEDGIAVSADGRYLLTITEDDESLQVWESGTGNEVAVDQALVQGERFVAETTGPAVRERPTHDNGFRGTLVRVRGPGGSLGVVEFGDVSAESVQESRDGRFELTPISEGVVGLVERGSGRPHRQPAGHENAVTGMAFSHDGALLASASGAVRLWETVGDLQPSALQKGEGHLVAFSPSNEVVSLSLEGKLSAWEPDSSSPRFDVSVDIGMPIDIVVDQDGSRVLAGERTAGIDAWNLADGGALSRVLDPMGIITSIALTPDGSAAAVAQRDGRVQVWNLEDLTVRAEPDTDEPIRHVAISPDGGCVAAGGHFSVTVFDFRSTGEPFSAEVERGRLASIAMTPAGDRLASVTDERALEVWDIAQRARLAAFRSDAPFSVCAISPDGATIAAGDEAGAVHILRLRGAGPGTQPEQRQSGTSETGDLLADAEAHLEGGRPGDALSVYESVLERDPRNVVAVGQRCHMLYQLNRHEECAEAITEALGGSVLSSDEKANIEVLLGGIAFQNDDPAGALTAFRSASGRDPANFDAHHNAGLALVRLRRLDEALDEFMAARQIEDRPEVAIQVAQCLLQLDRDAEAVIEFETLLARGYVQPRIHYLMAMSLAALGRIPESRRSLERFVDEAAPEDSQLVAQARQMLGR